MAEDLYAVIDTTLGAIEVQLFPNHAPKTVENFVGLAEGTKEWTDPQTGTKAAKKLYDGTIFHRVISGFMLQGGDPLGRGTGGPGYTFKDEIHPELQFNKPYLLAMGQCRSRHQRLAVLHHRGPDTVAQRQAHDLRRGHQRHRRGGEDRRNRRRRRRPAAPGRRHQHRDDRAAAG
jgi:hypothetical protein